VTHTVNALEETGADALCACPKQLFSGWVCPLVKPLTVWGIMLVLPTIPSDPNPLLVSANGQMLTFTRPCLQKIGGFESVKDSILEDIALVSVWRYHTGRNHWKGRMYDLKKF
jgi:hypothetical protein